MFDSLRIRWGAVSQLYRKRQAPSVRGSDGKDYYYIVGSARGRYEINPVFWLATREGTMGLSRPLEIARFDPARQKKKIGADL